MESLQLILNEMVFGCVALCFVSQAGIFKLVGVLMCVEPEFIIVISAYLYNCSIATNFDA